MAIESVTLREASADDAAALASLRRALFEETGRQEPAGSYGAFEEDCFAAFARQIADGSCLAWLAEAVDARAVGSISLLIFPRLPSPASSASREGYLLNVYTAPDWRGRGVATALLREALTKARALGLARLRLHATDRGRPVYAAVGFVPRLDEMELDL